jgi:large subunit ribosomal protein L33
LLGDGFQAGWFWNFNAGFGIMRDIIQLACGDCKRKNYSTTKNKKKTTQRLEFKKYCRFCRKHTLHKETK